MRVKLRKKSGEFCTFGEFCSEWPGAEVVEIHSPKDAADYLQEAEELFRRMEFYAEIIRNLNVPRDTHILRSGVHFTDTGRWLGDSSLEETLEKGFARLEKIREFADLWRCDSYEVSQVR